MAYIHRFHPRRDVISALVRSEFEGNVSAAARAARITPAALHDILSGRRHGRLETLESLAEVLSVDLRTIADEVNADHQAAA